MTTPLVFGSHTAIAAVDLLTPAAADVDFYIESVDADGQTGATDGLFTASDDFAATALATTEPARTVTLTVSENDAEDTVETIIFTGRDDTGRKVVEVVDAATWDDSVVFETTNAFRSLESVQLTGWVEATNADSITVGFGDKLGLGVKLGDTKEVVLGLVAGAGEAPANVAVSDEDKALNVVDLSGATYNGSKQVYALLVPTVP